MESPWDCRIEFSQRSQGEEMGRLAADAQGRAAVECAVGEARERKLRSFFIDDDRALETVMGDLLFHDLSTPCREIRIAYGLIVCRIGGDLDALRVRALRRIDGTEHDRFRYRAETCTLHV